MKSVKSGYFFGEHYKDLKLKDIKLTDTEYTHEYVDWHYHENPYFTFLLHGQLIEINKKGKTHIGANGLLFHNWDDAHCNIRPNVKTRGFHTELSQAWFDKYDIDYRQFSGNQLIINPILIRDMYLIIYTSKLDNFVMNASIDMQLISFFSTLNKTTLAIEKSYPSWMERLIELLHNSLDESELSLTSLATELNIHPVYLSRAIPKFLNMTLSNYIQLIKLNRATSEMSKIKQPLTNITFNHNYFDQSHFIRMFKKYYIVTPKRFVKSFHG